MCAPLLLVFACCLKATMAAILQTEYPNPVQEITTQIVTVNMTEDFWVPSESFASSAFSAFTVIAVSEFGDKTFFIAVVLALSHSAVWVFVGSVSALAFMTLLSAGLGLVSSVIPEFWVQCLSALLFLLFGFKMLNEGLTMSSTAGRDEMEEVQKSVDTKMTAKGKGYDGVDVESGTAKFTVRWVFLEAFAMTFLAEWGDRSQITTVLLAAKHSVVGVILGATLGHAACTLLAVLGGHIVADKISLRAVTIFGALLFLAFGLNSVISATESAYAGPDP